MSSSCSSLARSSPSSRWILSNVRGVGAAALLIGFLSIAGSIDEDEVFFQSAKDAVAANAQPVFAFTAFELFHVTGEIILQLVESEADVASQFLRQTAKLRESVVAKFDAVTRPATKEKTPRIDKDDCQPGQVSLRSPRSG